MQRAWRFVWLFLLVEAERLEIPIDGTLHLLRDSKWDISSLFYSSEGLPDTLGEMLREIKPAVTDGHYETYSSLRIVESMAIDLPEREARKGQDFVPGLKPTTDFVVGVEVTGRLATQERSKHPVAQFNGRTSRSSIRNSAAWSHIAASNVLGPSQEDIISIAVSALERQELAQVIVTWADIVALRLLVTALEFQMWELTRNALGATVRAVELLRLATSYIDAFAQVFQKSPDADVLEPASQLPLPVPYICIRGKIYVWKNPEQLNVTQAGSTDSLAEHASVQTVKFNYLRHPLVTRHILARECLHAPWHDGLSPETQQELRESRVDEKLAGEAVRRLFDTTLSHAVSDLEGELDKNWVEEVSSSMGQITTLTRPIVLSRAESFISWASFTTTGCKWRGEVLRHLAEELLHLIAKVDDLVGGERRKKIQ